MAATGSPHASASITALGQDAFKSSENRIWGTDPSRDLTAGNHSLPTEGEAECSSIFHELMGEHRDHHQFHRFGKLQVLLVDQGYRRFPNPVPFRPSSAFHKQTR
jgi:hypothetical protein